MAQATTRQRGRTAPSRAKWLALIGLGGIALAVTFAVGVLVGRQWLHHPHPAQSSVEPAKKPVVAARRSGLMDPPVERPAPPEKLTFYQTLTAPMSAPPPVKVDSQAKPSPPSGTLAPASAERLPVATTSTARTDKAASEHVTPAAAAPRVEKDKPSADRAAASRPSAETRADWVVQVGAFKDRNQAEAARRPLAAAGYDVYVLAVPDGADVRYKVRLGGFKTRDDASRIAQRLKQERSVAAFVAQR